MAEISLELLIDSAKKEIIYMTCWYWRVKKKNMERTKQHMYLLKTCKNTMIFSTSK